ncbi:MAG: hypothetical protein V8T31_02530 [Lachnospiraceae bacterium]
MKKKEAIKLVADGVDWNLRTFTYDGTSFVQQADTGIAGSA